MRIILTAICLFALIAAQANANMTVKDYKVRMASKDTAKVAVTKVYVQGLAEGIFWVNAFIEKKGKEPLYCQPEKLVLDKENYVEILDEQIKTLSKGLPEKEWEELEIGLLLFHGLQDTFPCKGK
jgi:hypothetical protein